MEILKAGPRSIINQFHFRGGLGHQDQVKYDVNDILASLHVEFRREVYTVAEFWVKMNGMINRANELMGETRIELPKEHIGERVREKHDLIFKYRVYLYDRQWT